MITTREQIASKIRASHHGECVQTVRVSPTIVVYLWTTHSAHTVVRAVRFTLTPGGDIATMRAGEKHEIQWAERHEPPPVADVAALIERAAAEFT